MTREQLYTIWAPPSSIWSPWVAPVLFAQLSCGDQSAPKLSIPDVRWVSEIGSCTAVIVDVSGGESVGIGAALANHGFRPVPIFNASPGPVETADLSITNPAVSYAVVDLGPVAEAICGATPLLTQLSLNPNAPPVFLLDSMRLEGHRPLQEGMFDNRWIVFPQDFPSADFLMSHGVERVLLVQQDRREPANDLAHVLLRWQEKGIEILAMQLSSADTPRTIVVARPKAFKAAWYRALAMIGLRRSAAGGFGSYIPESSAAG